MLVKTDGLILSHSCQAKYSQKSLEKKKTLKLFGEDLTFPNRILFIWNRPVCAHHVPTGQLLHLEAFSLAVDVVLVLKYFPNKVDRGNHYETKWNKKDTKEVQNEIDPRMCVFILESM